MVLMTWIKLSGIALNVIYALLLTTLTGSILTIVWYVIGTIMERMGLANIRHSFLKVVLLFYIVPFSYILIRAYKRLYRTADARILGSTGTLRTIAAIGFVVWFIVAVYLLYRSVREYRRINRIFNQSFACDSSYERALCDAAELLGIRLSNISLMQNYAVQVPLITGVFKARIILPVKTYSEKELKTILLHELTHYKHKDILLKYCMELVNAMHFFNPCVWFLNYKLELWCEYTCDYNVYPIVGVKEYFSIIVSMTYNINVSNMAVHLVSEEDELKERINYMKKYYNKKCSKFIAAALVAVMVGMSGTSVYAATH